MAFKNFFKKFIIIFFLGAFVCLSIVNAKANELPLILHSFDINNAQTLEQQEIEAALQMTPQEILSEIIAKQHAIEDLETELQNAKLSVISDQKFYTISYIAEKFAILVTTIKFIHILRFIHKKQGFQSFSAFKSVLKEKPLPVGETLKPGESVKALGQNMFAWIAGIAVVRYFMSGYADELKISEREKLQLQTGLRQLKSQLRILEKAERLMLNDLHLYETETP